MDKCYDEDNLFLYVYLLIIHPLLHNHLNQSYYLTNFYPKITLQILKDIQNRPPIEPEAWNLPDNFFEHLWLCNFRAVWSKSKIFSGKGRHKQGYIVSWTTSRIFLVKTFSVTSRKRSPAFFKFGVGSYFYLIFLIYARCVLRFFIYI